MCGGKTARARGAGKYIGCREDTTWNVSKGASGVWGNSSGRQARRQANSTRALAGCLVWARTSSRVLVDSSCAARQIEMAMLLRRCCWPHRQRGQGLRRARSAQREVSVTADGGHRREAARWIGLPRRGAEAASRGGSRSGRRPRGDAEAVTRQGSGEAGSGTEPTNVKMEAYCTEISKTAKVRSTGFLEGEGTHGEGHRARP